MYRLINSNNLYNLIEKLNKEKDIEIIYIQKTYSGDEKPHFVEWTVIVKDGISKGV